VGRMGQRRDVSTREEGNNSTNLDFKKKKKEEEEEEEERKAGRGRDMIPSTLSTHI
jgi:hypothetical protein